MFLRKRILIVVPILWLGFVLAISFMEAWLKFQAEGVSQEAGLSIGRLIFGALNKVEIFFFLTLLAVLIGKYSHLTTKTKWRIVSSLGLVLLLQTFHLLPVLDDRAAMIIRGDKLPYSYFHFYYVALEVVKVAVLVVTINKILAMANNQLFKSKADLNKSPRANLGYNTISKTKIQYKSNKMKS